MRQFVLFDMLETFGSGMVFFSGDFFFNSGCMVWKWNVQNGLEGKLIGRIQSQLLLLLWQSTESLGFVGIPCLVSTVASVVARQHPLCFDFQMIAVLMLILAWNQRTTHSSGEIQYYSLGEFMFYNSNNFFMELLNIDVLILVCVTSLYP